MGWWAWRCLQKGSGVCCNLITTPSVWIHRDWQFPMFLSSIYLSFNYHYSTALVPYTTGLLLFTSSFICHFTMSVFLSHHSLLQSWNSHQKFDQSKLYIVLFLPYISKLLCTCSYENYIIFLICSIFIIPSWRFNLPIQFSLSGPNSKTQNILQQKRRKIYSYTVVDIPVFHNKTIEQQSRT